MEGSLSNLNEAKAVTQWGDRAALQATFRAISTPMVRDEIKNLSEESERGPLNRYQVKMLKIFASVGFAEAQELLEKCRRTCEPKRGKLKLSPKRQRVSHESR